MFPLGYENIIFERSANIQKSIFPPGFTAKATCTDILKYVT